MRARPLHLTAPFITHVRGIALQVRDLYDWRPSTFAEIPEGSKRRSALFSDSRTVRRLENLQATSSADAVSTRYEPTVRRSFIVLSDRVLIVLKSWIQDHHMLDSEPEEVPRIREFLSYIKSPEKHEKTAKSILGMMEVDVCPPFFQSRLLRSLTACSLGIS